MTDQEKVQDLEKEIMNYRKKLNRSPERKKQCAIHYQLAQRYFDLAEIKSRSHSSRFADYTSAISGFISCERLMSTQVGQGFVRWCQGSALAQRGSLKTNEEDLASAMDVFNDTLQMRIPLEQLESPTYFKLPCQEFQRFQCLVAA